MKDKIIISGLYKNFQGTTILQDINLKIAEGDLVAVVGSSGSGKSVLIKCISGLFTASKGSIKIDDTEVAKLYVADRPKHVREKMGMLFQSNALFDSMTIGENITFGLYNKIAKRGYVSSYQRMALNKLAIEQLEIVGLAKSNLEKYPYELSGGMQKRVAIARLISTKPEIILLDEPTTGLDPVTASKNRINATMIVITHDPICVSEVAQKIILIENKTIRWFGGIKDLQFIDNQYLDPFK
jgi:phospholipid/cholesterol/gamma-HCH transport system ATP-binding protein